MFRAAAITPLTIEEDEPIRNLRFDPEQFLANALEHADASGSA